MFTPEDLQRSRANANNLTLDGTRIKLDAPGDGAALMFARQQGTIPAHKIDTNSNPPVLIFSTPEDAQKAYADLSRRTGIDPKYGFPLEKNQD